MNALDDLNTEPAAEVATPLPNLVSETIPPPESVPPALPPSILQIPVEVQVVLGSARLPIGKVAELRSGSAVMLDQKLGSPVSILVNGKEVAKGDLFVLDSDSGRLGVTIVELAPKVETS